MKKKLLVTAFALFLGVVTLFAQPALINTASLISQNWTALAATTITASTVNTTTAGITTANISTANILSLAVGSGSTPVTKILSATGTLDFPNIFTNTFTNLTITVNGAGTNGNVFFNQTVPANMVAYSAYVSATNTVTIRANNVNPLAAIDPAVSSFAVTVFQP